MNTRWNASGKKGEQTQWLWKSTDHKVCERERADVRYTETSECVNYCFTIV